MTSVLSLYTEWYMQAIWVMITLAVEDDCTLTWLVGDFALGSRFSDYPRI